MIPGGPEAARHARHAVSQRLGGHVSDGFAEDLAIVISELVTNSVLHADVGPGRYLHVNVGAVDDRLLVTVSDRGSRALPRLIRGAEGEGRDLACSWWTWSRTRGASRATTAVARRSGANCTQAPARSSKPEIAPV
jgi:hypothetical protein